MSFRYSSSVETTGNSTEPDIVYYNADIIADAYDAAEVLNGIDRDPPIRFQETRSSPLIGDISKYMFSIIRFTMDGAGKDLPLFIPNINDSQPDINQTTYSITLEYTVYYVHPTTAANESHLFRAQRFIVYRPETVNAPLPNPPNSQNSKGEFLGQDLRGRYYFVYTYQHWLDLVNEAFNSAFYDTLAAVPGTSHPTLSISNAWAAYWVSLGGNAGNQPALQGGPPNMTYEKSSNLFSVNAPAYCCGNQAAYTAVGSTPATYVAPLPIYAWSGGNANAVPGTLNPTANVLIPSYATNLLQGTELMNVFFNTDMNGLFTNFNNIFIGDELSGRTNMLLITNKGNNLVSYLKTGAFSTTIGNGAATTDGPLLVSLQQDYESTSTLWSPISSIVFSSTMIPIFPEQTGTPLTYGEGNANTPSESTSAFTPIITDISVPMIRAEDYRSFLAYTPTGEYRLSSFTGSRSELRNIDIQVFWKNRINNILYPITMFNLSSVSIKMMFRKK